MKGALIIVCFLALIQNTKAEKKNKQNNHNSSNEKCIVRDGRDGIPGPPGVQGTTGPPGRDGRDCISDFLLKKVLDLEKRLDEMNDNYHRVEQKRRKAMSKLEVYLNQTETLLKHLITKKIINPDVLPEAIEWRQPGDQMTTPSDFTNARSTLDTTDERQPTKSNKPGRQTMLVTTRLHTTTRNKGSRETTKKQNTGAQSGKFYNLSRNLRIPTSGSTTESRARLAELLPSAKVTSKDVCKKRFHVHQKVLTNGAVNMDAFEIDHNMYLAVANFHLFKSKDGYNTESFIYKMDPQTSFFQLFQKLPTLGCRALVSFVREGAQYLVAANHYDGDKYSLQSVIYKWNGSQFEEHQHVETFGASSAQLFTIDGEDYLVFANYRNKTTVSVASVVYKWKNDKLVVFQKIQTHGGVDTDFFQSSDGKAFLVFANYYTPEKEYDVESSIFKWNGEKFVFLQAIKTSAATCVDMFEDNGVVFLAIASHRTSYSWHSSSTVFQWNGTAFVVFQKIRTTAAVKIHHFYDAGSLYLAIANYFDEVTDYIAHSVIYKYNGKKFKKYQGILTTGGYDLKPFTYKGVPYLASAFRFNGRNSTLESYIYKMTPSCDTENHLLP